MTGDAASDFQREALAGLAHRALRAILVVCSKQDTVAEAEAQHITANFPDLSAKDSPLCWPNLLMASGGAFQVVIGSLMRPRVATVPIEGKHALPVALFYRALEQRPAVPPFEVDVSADLLYRVCPVTGFNTGNAIFSVRLRPMSGSNANLDAPLSSAFWRELDQSAADLVRSFGIEPA